MMKLPLIVLGGAAMGATMVAAPAGAHDNCSAPRAKYLAPIHGEGGKI